MPAAITHPRRGALLVALSGIMLTLLCSATPAWAHDSIDDSIVVVVDDQRAIVTASVAFAELGFDDTSGDGLLDAEELADQEAAASADLVATVRDRVAVRINGEAVEISGAGVPSTGETNNEATHASPYVVLLLATGSYDADVADVELSWRFDGPTAAVALSHAEGSVTGDLSDDGTVAMSLDMTSTGPSFLGLDIEHVMFGTVSVALLSAIAMAVTVTWRASTAARLTDLAL